MKIASVPAYKHNISAPVILKYCVTNHVSLFLMHEKEKGKMKRKQDFITLVINSIFSYSIFI